MNKVKITVFTPTYNRAYTLERLYKSLLNQTCYDFEWLIVDDGSTDGTSALIDSFQNNQLFDVRYYRQENNGKHVAINKGVSLAQGDLFFIVDSDDYLTINSIETIITWENSISDKSSFAGIAGNKGFTNESIIGRTFSGKYVDATSLERDKYHIEGDKAEVFYTNILKQFPFPVFDGERFITENVVWYRIAAEGYRLRWFNEIIYIAEYLEDGLSAKQIQLYADNPKGFALSIKQKIKYRDYGKKQIDAEYFDYYQIVKRRITLHEAAEYLEINPFRLISAIVLFYGRVAINKAIKRKIDD